MTFRPEEVAAFQANFNANKEKIRAFPGCAHLELWQDADQPHIFMTYSHWESAEALEAYRHSDLFKSVWAVTKPLFAEKTFAFSAKKMEEIG